MALNEIDPVTRMRRTDFEPLNIIRVGTSGLLQESSELGVSIISSHAVGLDNTGLYFNLLNPEENCETIERQVKQMLDRVMDPDGRFYGKIHPYAAAADTKLVELLIESAETLNRGHEVGITVSAPGFNASQGRDTARMPLSIPDIDLHLSQLDPLFNRGRYLNMEMESSFLFHFAAGHGYRAATVCAGLANRRLNTFLSDYDSAVSAATRIALDALEALRISNVPRPTAQS
jgi:uridine phosphorylase